MSAKAFKLFQEGKDRRNAVIELQATCELVDHLYFQWKNFGPEWHLAPKELAQLRGLFDWWQDPPTSAGFVAAVNIHLQKITEYAVAKALADVNKTNEVNAKKPEDQGVPLSEHDRQLIAQAEAEAAAEAADTTPQK